MQKDKKEAALGVTSTQSGKMKCDNISIKVYREIAGKSREAAHHERQNPWI